MPRSMPTIKSGLGNRKPSCRDCGRRHEYLHGLQGIIDRTLIEAALDAIVSDIIPGILGHCETCRAWLRPNVLSGRYLSSKPAAQLAHIDANHGAVAVVRLREAGQVRIQSRNAEIAWLPFVDDADANHRSVVQHPPTRQLSVLKGAGEQLLRPFLGGMRRVESCVSFVFVKGKQIIVGRPARGSSVATIFSYASEIERQYQRS
jgi:hypothetical protein